MKQAEVEWINVSSEISKAILPLLEKARTFIPPDTKIAVTSDSGIFSGLEVNLKKA